MPKIRVELAVEMADGATHTVVADQRDFAKWEVQPFAADAASHLKVRFLGWSALTRQQLTSMPFQKFNDTECIEVLDAPATEGEEETEQEDPTAVI